MPSPNTYILSPPGFPTNILLDAVAFHHFLLPGAFATATALATLAALAALEVASALARLPGLTLGSLEKATLAFGGFSSLATLQKAGRFGSGILVVDQARLSVGHHGQKKTENEDKSLGDHFSELVVK